MTDLTTAEGCVSYMMQSTSGDDWNSRVDEVKKANGGDYPSFWLGAVIKAGIHTQAMGTKAVISIKDHYKDGTVKHIATFDAATGERIY